MVVELEADRLRQLTLLGDVCRRDDKPRFLDGPPCPGWTPEHGDIATLFGLADVNTITFHLDRGPNCFFEASIYFDRFVWIVCKPNGLVRSGIHRLVSDLIGELLFFSATT